MAPRVLQDLSAHRDRAGSRAYVTATPTEGTTVTVIGWHASHEQIHPKDLLASLQHAERAGFTAAMCSDHFAPWSDRQGHSGFAWAWLGAALQATELPIGGVTAPGQRYHPAIIAQAVGTLEAMYPGRFWAALGSGENMNEHITGDALVHVLAAAEGGPEPARVHRLERSHRLRDDRRVVALAGGCDAADGQFGRLQCRAEPGPGEA